MPNSPQEKDFPRAEGYRIFAASFFRLNASRSSKIPQYSIHSPGADNRMPTICRNCPRASIALALMTMLPPPPRVQCDHCRTVIALAGTRSDHFGSDLYTAGWRARPIRGRYKHACPICAIALIAKFEADAKASWARPP